MAKILNNLVMQGSSGQLGNQLVFRQGKGGQTIIAVKPSHTNGHTYNPSQLAQQAAFRSAIAYARGAKSQEIYLAKAQGTPMSAFNVAVADWFNKPEVVEINTTTWTGQAGEVIRIQAQDDTCVTSVKVQMIDDEGNVFDAGDAVQAEGPWWEFTTTVTSPSNAKISATAYDLPGNSHMLTWQTN